MKDCSITVRQLISFAEKFVESGAESFQFKNLTKHTEKNILMNFHECIQKFFTSKMQEKLITDFTVNNENKLEFAVSSGKDFFRLFSTQQLFSPELVWNDETRREMLAKL